MDSPSPPPAPDPAATAAAQGAINKETAIAQAGLNMVNQQTPNGSLSYNNIGTWTDGTPRYEAVTSLSPDQQELYGLNTQTQKNLGQIGVAQSGRIGDLLNTPFDISNDATESRLMELGRQRLDPVLQQRTASTEQSLKNRGVNPGTEAYRRAMEADTQGQNDAYNQLLLTGRGQSVQEQLAARNQPINEIAALESGSQVSQPNFVGTPQTQIQPADITGPTMAAYNGALQANGQQQSGQNALMGGLFGLGGSALGGWGSSGFKLPGAPAASDIRVKEDIKRVGTTDGGFPVYTFRYIGSPTVQMGVMAQEVEKVLPEAVVEIGGVKHVRYDMVH